MERALRVHDLPLSADAWRVYGDDLKVLADFDLPKVAGWNLLVLQWRMPKRTSGGIIVAEQARLNDMFQGRIGLVLEVGPLAYSDPEKYPTGPWAVVGDSVMWNLVESTISRFSFGDPTDPVVLATIYDDKISLTGVDPLRAARR